MPVELVNGGRFGAVANLNTAVLVVEKAFVAEVKLAVGDLFDLTVDGVNAVAVEAVAAKKAVGACRVVLATRMEFVWT